MSCSQTTNIDYVLFIFCRRMKVNDYLQANIKEIPAGLDRINKTKERVSHAKCVLN